MIRRFPVFLLMLSVFFFGCSQDTAPKKTKYRSVKVVNPNNSGTPSAAEMQSKSERISKSPSKRSSSDKERNENSSQTMSADNQKQVIEIAPMPAEVKTNNVSNTNETDESSFVTAQQPKPEENKNPFLNNQSQKHPEPKSGKQPLKKEDIESGYEQFTARFLRYDENKDNKLDEKELLKLPALMEMMKEKGWQAYDLNKDKALDVIEITAFLLLKNKQNPPLPPSNNKQGSNSNNHPFKAYDYSKFNKSKEKDTDNTNNNNRPHVMGSGQFKRDYVTRSNNFMQRRINELKKKAEENNSSSIQIPEWFIKRDQDKDGQLGLYEWEKKELAKFKDYDLNRDGYITVEEIISTKQTLKVDPIIKQPISESTDPVDQKLVNAAQELIEKYDTNLTKKLSEEELKADTRNFILKKLVEVWKQHDTNNDNTLDVDELATTFKALGYGHIVRESMNNQRNRRNGTADNRNRRR